MVLLLTCGLLANKSAAEFFLPETGKSERVSASRWCGFGRSLLLVLHFYAKPCRKPWPHGNEFLNAVLRVSFFSCVCKGGSRKNGADDSVL